MLCEECCSSWDWKKCQCPICHKNLYEVDLDPFIVRLMLNTQVRCVNSAKVTEQPLVLQKAQIVTPTNNLLDVPDELFTIQEQFNSNSIAIQTQNFVRKD